MDKVAVSIQIGGELRKLGMGQRVWEAMDCVHRRDERDEANRLPGLIVYWSRRVVVLARLCLVKAGLHNGQVFACFLGIRMISTQGFFADDECSDQICLCCGLIASIMS